MDVQCLGSVLSELMGLCGVKMLVLSQMPIIGQCIPGVGQYFGVGLVLFCWLSRVYGLAMGMLTGGVTVNHNKTNKRRNHMRLDTTPQNQISPTQSVEIRTDKLRNCLRDLRANGLGIAQAMGATGYREIRLDDGTELHLTQASAWERGWWHPNTCVAVRGNDGEPVVRYRIFPR